MCCALLPPRAAPAYCARGFSRLRKSFLEIITLKIVQQVSRFLTFFFFFFNACRIMHPGWDAQSGTAADTWCLPPRASGSRGHQTHRDGVACSLAKPPSPQVGSVLRRFLIQLGARSEERGQTSRDNAFDGDKNVSMELYSKTRIAALYLMCTHFILAICLK